MLRHKKAFHSAGPLWWERVNNAELDIASPNKSLNKHSSCRWFDMPWRTYVVSIISPWFITLCDTPIMLYGKYRTMLHSNQLYQLYMPINGDVILVYADELQCLLSLASFAWTCFSFFVIANLRATSLEHYVFVSFHPFQLMLFPEMKCHITIMITW